VNNTQHLDVASRDEKRRITKLKSKLRAWMEQNQRDLPWRHTRDPWSILVSEFMLQQTQVSRVIDRWSPFLLLFPDVAAAANAGPAAIIREWEGLGYNRRALQLHRCAHVIAREHEGEFPQTISALTALPGIGGYTARAVLAFAYEHDVAVLDTNVARILARAIVGAPLSPKQAQHTADSLVRKGDGWFWNQGMLDFGATICKKQHPLCEQCPIASQCAWRLATANESGVSVDPAIGSAGVPARQSTFQGSDRQGRGRLVSALRKGEVASAELEQIMRWPTDRERAIRVAETIVADGLACWDSELHYLSLV
jgi:A/G-specific adenine glycosylase